MQTNTRGETITSSELSLPLLLLLPPVVQIKKAFYFLKIEYFFHYIVVVVIVVEALNIREIDSFLTQSGWPTTACRGAISRISRPIE